MTDRDVQSQRRDARFDESPLGGGMCSLLLDVALFPVRYAIDEAPSQAGEPAPHPLASPWQGPNYPELQTRGYTLRQLRDGWVYVWVEEEGEQRIDEHRVQGATFGGQPHLTYSTQARLALAYSPVQWTERIQAYMLADAQARQRVMRSVDLLAALTGTAQPGGAFPANVGPITQLAEHVADVTPNGAVDGFTSTTVSTAEREESEGEGEESDDGLYEVLSVKPEITQDSVLAQVERHDEALFVALDDDLGIVNDLIMALLGREAELEAFLDEHGHKLQTALAVQELCHIDINDLIEDDVRHDPERYHAVTVKTGELFDAIDRLNKGSDHSILLREQRVSRLQRELRELGMANPPGRNSAQYEEWHAKEHPRLDVNLDGAIAFVTEKGPQLERLQEHSVNSLADLTVWLERLPTSAQELCFDTCVPEQNQAMVEFASLVTEALGATQEGRAWLNGTIRERDSLIGLAMLNFEPALAAAFDTISQHYIESGTAEGEPADSGVSAPGVATRIRAAIAVLKLESVQNSKIYQELAPHVKEAFETLRQGVGGPSRKAWETLAYQFLPALSAGGQVSVEHTAKALVHSMMVAFVHPDMAASELVLDPEFEAKHRQWRAQDQVLAKRIRDARRVSQRPGYSPHDRRAQLRGLEQLEQQRLEHAYNEPKRIVAATNESLDLSIPGNKARVENFASVGYRELREQHRLKVQGGASAAHQYLKSRLEKMGGGLALLIAGLNLYNFMDAVHTARTNGVDEEELRELGITAGYAAGAVMGLWVMPFWNAHAKQTAMLAKQLTKVTGAGVKAWMSVNEAQTARLAAKLATRVAGLTAIGAVSAGLETWQVYQDYGKATSGVERSALMVKGFATFIMGGTAGVQLAGAIAGRWFAFGWIMAPWAAITLFTVGVIYLLASHIAARYKREGIRGWLYKSTWGKAGSEWPDTDEGHSDEWRNLMEVLLQPSVRLTNVAEVEFDSSSSSYWGVGSSTRTHHGFWVQLALPAALAGETVKLSELAGGGFWAPADSFEQGPFRQGASRENLPAASGYEAADLRVWQAWIPASEQEEDAPFALTVDYSESLLSSPEGRADFTFYKPRAAHGKKLIEPNSEESRGIRVPARLELKVPLTPEEQG